MRPRITLLLAVGALLQVGAIQAQSYRRGGTEFNATRVVDVPPDKSRPVMVIEFFHHGEIKPGGRNVVVSAKNKKLVPSRVLQLGPGDLCRLAFQTVRGETSYEVFYGGEPPEEGEVPKWTNRDGLLLETRHYKECNLNSLDSVREAFNSSKPIGADYVENVQHAHNPFAGTPAPFLSRYSGYLRVPSTGTYGFMVASQDCSFLLIDDKVVTSAPGRHRPMRQGRPGLRKDIRLTAGAHKFEYYHAATGPEAMMVAAWEVNPTEPKPKPAAIPTEAFRTGSIGRVLAGPVKLRDSRMVPDFLLKIAGDVPLPGEETPEHVGPGPEPYTGIPLIGVLFKNTSPQALTLKAKCLWDFGDGQTSEALDPAHVYLRPGVYQVTLSIKRGSRVVKMTNRVGIDRPKLTKKDTLHKLDDYLKLIETYDPSKLDAASLRQLVLAYQWKAETLLAPEPEDEEQPDQEKPEEKKEPEKPKTPEELKAEAEAIKAEARQYINKAVTVGRAAFEEQSAAEGDEALHELARLIGPMARDQLGESKLALEIWQGAVKKIRNVELKADCEMEVADIAVNDYAKAEAAKPLLEAASTHLGQGKMGPKACRLQRIWGDYYALSGDGKSARKAYRDAEKSIGSTRSHTEQTAWRGAYSRSAEKFLKTGEWGRAVVEIRRWQQDFPAEKIDGYLTLVYARYWAGRQKYDQAIAQAEQLMTVNADSPYVDQILLVAANCEVKRGRADRALATLQSILKDYPGSPLVPVVRKNIAALKSGQTEEPKKPPRRRPSSDEKN